MRFGQVPRAMLLVLLLGGSTLAGLAPPAAAQSPTIICYQSQDTAGEFLENGTCQPGLRDPANYLQGEKVHIQINNVDTARPTIRVACTARCQDLDGRTWTTQWDGNGVTFPDDFVEQLGNGVTQAAERALPYYNSTWETTVELGAGQEVKRGFNVWLLSLWRSENQTLHPGETHRFRASGFDPRTPLEFVVERRVSAGRYEPIVQHDGQAPVDGVFRYDWQVHPSEAEKIRDCGVRTDDCYRASIRGVGRGNETVTMRVALATLQVTNVVAPEPDERETRERTEEVELVFGVNYPGGGAREGPKLTPNEINRTITNPDQGLRVAIERLGAQPGEAPVEINTTLMRFVPDRFAWVLEWTIPRDLPLNDTVNGPRSDYRLVLQAQQDKWGNRVPSRVLGNFTITPATLAPTLVTPIEDVPRADEQRFVFDIRYHNDSILGVVENETGLRGCFVRDTTPLRPDCPQESIVWARHENGSWVLRKRYDRDYEHVNDAGNHRLFLLDGMEDKWGNRVDGRTNDGARAFVSDVFKVVPGSPRINFTTVSRGEATEVLERGNRVTVQAVIRYADGTPFNHLVLANESRSLNITLTKRGPNGAIQSQEPLTLSLSDANAGRWVGSFELTRDDTVSPVGRWSFRFDVQDNLTTPNTNLTSFDREVAAALIHVWPTYQPPSTVPIGSIVKYRFRLTFEDGRPVLPETIGSRLTGYVHRWDKSDDRHVGNPVSGILVPSPVPGSTGEYSIDYQIPREQFAGDYVIRLEGGDSHGNRIGPGAYSRAWASFAETRERSVLVQPPLSVKRGDSATVIFDGQEGDVGGPAIGVPALRLERWDAGTSAWVLERQTTRISDPTTFDHIGVFPVTTNTVIGVYRFRLEGRDHTYNHIHSVSANFTVEPTAVQRAITEAPPERVVKGEPIQFGFERIEGDRVVLAEILFNGRPASLQRPVMTSQGDHINVTFVVPYELDTGNYSVRIGGRDLYGNTIEVLSPQIDVQPANLLGKVIGNPSRVVERGETATLLFGITNPDGGFYLAPDEPLVEVHNGTGVVARAELRRQGLTFEASWTPDIRTEESEYYFVVSGTGLGGNAFPTLRSQTFRVAPGIVTLGAAAEPNREHTRMNTITFAVPFSADHEFVAFSLGYYGPSYDVSAALFETRDPTTTTVLPHTLDVQSGRYVARFVTDHTTPLGAYRIFMEGRDAQGNELVAKSRVFLLKPTTVLITWDAAQGGDETFGQGKTYTRSFVARYASGTVMNEEHGRPSVALLYDNGRDGRKPVTPAPEVTFKQDRWFVTWTGPDIMPDGAYTFSAGGSDIAGNPIAQATTNDIRLVTELPDSIGLFLKEVPAPSPALLLLALAALALVVGRRARR